jgi:hypothetical protein
MRIEASIDIAAPPTAVFAHVADIMNWPKNIDAIEHIEVLTAGPIGMGTRFRETRLMHGRKVRTELAIDAFDPPLRMRMVAQVHGSRYVMTHSVAALARGSRLTLLCEVMPVAWWARMLAALTRFLRGRLQKAISADLADLRDAVEGRRIAPAEEDLPR